MKCYLTIILLIITATVQRASGSTGGDNRMTVSGVVTDVNHQPVPGATVLILVGDSVLTGTSTNADGYYFVRISAIDGAAIKVSSIGFVVSSANLPALSPNIKHDVCLEQIDIPLPPISVAPEPENEIKGTILSAAEVSQGSRESIVPSNPIAAIRSPQVIRRGSQHSSNLRINGTSPTFYINGNKIGYDPNHYGAFSIIPGGIVDGIRIHTQGTSAKYGLPSAVELKTTTPFDSGFDGEANISVIASDGFVSVGKKNFFVTGSARKSVIDRLAKKINAKSEHQTIPPTNFRDIFISSGVRLSPTSKIAVDAYQVRDYLSLETGMATGRSGGVSTNLHSSEWFAGGRYEGICNSWLITGAASIRSSFESYKALNHEQFSQGLRLDLTEKSLTSSVGMNVTRATGTIDISAGFHGEFVSRRETDLAQQNWNFQPPDASSDLQYYFRSELNSQYGDMHLNKSGGTESGYLSLKKFGSGLSYEQGIRVDVFNSLSRQSAISTRHALDINLPSDIKTRLYYGSFAETPVNRILEPWQPVVRSAESTLQPIRTRLASLTIERSGLIASGFVKTFANLPVLEPQFDISSGSGEFLTMTSTGKSRFVGGDLSYSRSSVVIPNLAFYGYYSFTHAVKEVDGVTVLHELDIPHRFLASFDYTGIHSWTLGAGFQIQSGAPYTPAASPIILSSVGSESLYHQQLAIENTSRLPYQMVLNLRMQRSFDHGTLYLSVANVTNRENAIIHSYRGYIYDAGIMPSFGFSYRW